MNTVPEGTPSRKRRRLDEPVGDFAGEADPEVERDHAETKQHIQQAVDFCESKGFQFPGGLSHVHAKLAEFEPHFTWVIIRRSSVSHLSVLNPLGGNVFCYIWRDYVVIGAPKHA